jgi:PKD repeat protein
MVLGSTLASVLVAGALSLPSAASALPGFPPTASITASPNPTLRNQTVTFDGSQSSGDGLGGTIATYEWDLDGAGGFEVNTGSTPTATRSYTALGPVTVRVRVTDSDGDMDTDDDTLQVVNAAPTAGFIFEPSTPARNETITFSSTSSDPDGALTNAGHKWDFDNDGQYDDATGETVTHAFGTAGNKTVGLEVTDADGAKVTTSRPVFVQANPPNADFIFTPANPLSGQTITFDASASTPPAGETITARSWDLDGDGGFDDASGTTATSSYPSPGNSTVGLLVESSGGGFDIITKVVPIGNRAPGASFVFVPQAPQAGDTVKLTSTSADPDGPIAEQSWDLDADGQFDDGSGATADKVFDTPGVYMVGLKVSDANGATTAASAPINVGSKQLELMTPFPVVRFTGELKGNGNTKVERLSVRAPSGTDVAVTCRKKDCPFDEKVRAVKLVRVGFPAIEESLKPGVVIKVFATDPDKIGKYTRFKLREGKSPKRTDRCLEGQSRDPIKCPRS